MTTTTLTDEKVLHAEVVLGSAVRNLVLAGAQQSNVAKGAYINAALRDMARAADFLNHVLMPKLQPLPSWIDEDDRSSAA